MKVFNISDVETPSLLVAQRVNMPVTVSGETLKPGKFMEINKLTVDESRWVVAGVLAVGMVPDSYVKAKEKLYREAEKEAEVARQREENAKRVAAAMVPNPEPDISENSMTKTIVLTGDEDPEETKEIKTAPRKKSRKKKRG